MQSLHKYQSYRNISQYPSHFKTEKMSNLWSNKRFKSMTTPSHSPLSSSMHTTCTAAAQVEARDTGRRYKKLCVELVVERDTEWRQGCGAQRGEQGVGSSHSAATPSHQRAPPSAKPTWGFGQNSSKVEDLLREW